MQKHTKELAQFINTEDWIKAPFPYRQHCQALESKFERDAAKERGVSEAKPKVKWINGDCNSKFS